MYILAAFLSLPWLQPVSAAAVTLYGNTTSMSSAPISPTSTCGPLTDCNRPGNPSLLAIVNVFETMAGDPILLSSCSVLFNSRLEAFKSTGLVESFTYTYASNDGHPASTVSGVEYYSPDNAVGVGIAHNAQLQIFQPKPVAPCCFQCTVVGWDVQMFYWPTTAQARGIEPAVTELVDGNNYTFTSPTQYAVFKTLFADDICGTVGTAVESVTVGFPPGELKTAIAWNWTAADEADWFATVPSLPDMWEVADWSQAKDCVSISSTFYQLQGYNETYTDPHQAPQTCTNRTGGTVSCQLARYTITYDPCSPLLSVPTQIFEIQSSWKDCGSGMHGLSDPPYILTRGGSLSAPVVTVPGSTQMQPIATTAVADAQPANTPSPAIVTATISAPVTPTPTTTPNPPKQESSTVDTDLVSTSPPVKSLASTSIMQDSSTSIDHPPIPETTSTPDAVEPDTSTGSVALNTAQYLASSSVSDPSVQGTVVSSNQKSSDTTVLDPPAPYIIVTAGSTQTSAQYHSSAPFVVDGHTVTPGSSALVVSGTTYSIPASDSLPTASPPVVFANGSPSPFPGAQVSTQYQSPQPFTVGTQTITPGSPAAIVSGTTYSIPTQDPGETKVIVVNGSPSSLDSAISASSQSSQTFVVGTQTILPGSSAAIMSGTTYSIPSQASGSSHVVVINGTPSPLALPTLSASLISGLLAVGTQTITPGSPAIVASGSTYYIPTQVQPGSSVVVFINGSPSLLPTNKVTSPTQHSIQPGSSTYIIDSQTIVAGGQDITIAGTAVSLLPGGMSVVIGGSTTRAVTDALIATSATDTGAGVGGAIVGLGGFGTSTSVPKASASGSNDHGGQDVAQGSSGPIQTGNLQFSGLAIRSGVKGAWICALVAVVLILGL